MHYVHLLVPGTVYAPTVHRREHLLSRPFMDAVHKPCLALFMSREACINGARHDLRNPQRTLGQSVFWLPTEGCQARWERA